MQLTQGQIDSLVKLADHNDGKCDRCGRNIKIYTYSINAGHAKTLRAMADRTKETGNRAVNLNDLNIAYSAHTQQTKLRLHGLIAKYKENGSHKASHWVITTKGWSFLAGKPVESKVIVFDNQVLGHTGGLTTIKRITHDDVVYEDLAISTNEAEVYKDVRNTRKNVKYMAQYKGGNTSGIDKDTVYEIEIDGLRTGHPIIITHPINYTYRDISAFQQAWKVLKEIK